MGVGVRGEDGNWVVGWEWVEEGSMGGGWECWEGLEGWDESGVEDKGGGGWG